MGEYFQQGRYEVKFGTCEHLMYVRRDELERATESGDIENEASGNLGHMSDYLRLSCNYIYRFPVASEDGQTWQDANGRQPFDYIEIDVDNTVVNICHSGNVIHKGIDGILFNLPYCPYSMTAKEAGFRPINFYKTRIKIVGERYNVGNPNGYTLFECALCGAWFPCDEEELPHIQEALRRAGYTVEAERIKARTETI